MGIARVWEYNQPAAARKFVDLAQAMGMDVSGLSTTAAGDVAIEAVVRLARDVGIPENFSSVTPYAKSRIGTGWYANRPVEIRSDDQELHRMAEHLVADLCTPGNPRDVTVDDAVEILRDCVYESMDRKPDARARVAPRGTTVFRAGTPVEQAAVTPGA